MKPKAHRIDASKIEYFALNLERRLGFKTINTDYH